MASQIQDGILATGRRTILGASPLLSCSKMHVVHEKKAKLSPNFGSPGLSDILCNASTRNTTLSARCKFKACPALQLKKPNRVYGATVRTCPRLRLVAPAGCLQVAGWNELQLQSATVPDDVVAVLDLAPPPKDST